MYHLRFDAALGRAAVSWDTRFFGGTPIPPEYPTTESVVDLLRQTRLDATEVVGELLKRSPESNRRLVESLCALLGETAAVDDEGPRVRLGE